jgi:hypothetical protein
LHGAEVSEIYDALRSVNVPKDKARRAAEAMAMPEVARAYDARFDKVDIEIGKLQVDVALLKTDVALLKWMVGFNMAMTAGILGRMLFVHW